MLLYVAGPYRGDVAGNITSAKKVSIELWNAGHTVICPHMNSAHLELDCTLEDSEWLDRCTDLLMRCDGVVLVPGWDSSTGTKEEIDYARKAGIPVWEFPSIPPLHPVEVRSPKQVRGFLEIIMKMYRTHLSKNSDYSPANILGTGEIGLVTRLWDKIARLMNLSGFQIVIASMEFAAPKQPKHESIDDTLLDAATYSVIGMLLRSNSWGK